MMPKVYVFASNGYSEVTIGDFLKKINPGINWEVKSPTLGSGKMTKNDYKHLDMVPVFIGGKTGATGEALKEFMREEIETHPIMLDECAAILLEDGIDFRDKGMNSPDEFINEERTDVLVRLHRIKPTFTAQVLCLFAAPEIETWFAEDWENSFGNRRYFDPTVATQLRHKINSIRNRCGDKLEKYSQCYNEDEKFSDWIISETKSLADDINNDSKAVYSKDKHGRKFLNSINPDVVESHCREYFSKAYHAIKDLVSEGDAHD